MRTNTLNNN